MWVEEDQGEDAKDVEGEGVPPDLPPNWRSGPLSVPVPDVSRAPAYAPSVTRRPPGSVWDEVALVDFLWWLAVIPMVIAGAVMSGLSGAVIALGLSGIAIAGLALAKGNLRWAFLTSRPRAGSALTGSLALLAVGALLATGVGSISVRLSNDGNDGNAVAAPDPAPSSTSPSASPPTPTPTTPSTTTSAQTTTWSTPFAAQWTHARRRASASSRTTNPTTTTTTSSTPTTPGPTVSTTSAADTTGANSTDDPTTSEPATSTTSPTDGAPTDGSSTAVVTKSQQTR